MKILQILNCTAPNAVGGAEVSASELRIGLKDAGHEVKVLTLSTARTRNSIDPDTICIPLSNIYDPWRDPSPHSFVSKVLWKLIDWFNIVSFFRVISVMRSERPDVVLTHNLKGFSVSVWLAARALKIRIIHVLHDYYLVCSTSSLGKAGIRRCAEQCASCKAYSFPKRLLAGQVSDFIGVSDFVAKKHSSLLKIPEERFQVINNVRTAIQGDRHAPSLRVEVLRIGFIGRLEAAKGIGVFAEMCRRIGARMAFVIAGTAPSESEMKAIKNDLTGLDVKWLGQVVPSDFYSQIDCVVVPSIWDEPFPAVAYEPQLFGKVVIASAVGGISEIISDGETGFLFPSGDVDALVDILERLNLDRRLVQRISENALSNSSRFCDRDGMIRKYLQVVEGRQ